MKEIRKRLIAVLAALALAFSVFPLGSPAVEVKADAPEPITINTDLRGQNGVPCGGDAIHTGVFWYKFKDQIENPSEYWDVRWDQIEAYGKTTTPDPLFVLKPADDDHDAPYWDWDWDNENIDWSFKDEFVFDKILVDSDYRDGWNFITKELEIASCGAITISGDHWAPMKVLQSAVVREGGTLSLTGNNVQTVLEIGENATLTIENGVTLHIGAGNVIRVNKTGKVYVGNEPLEINGISFGENRNCEYDLTYDNSSWGAVESPHIIENVVLPRDEASMIYTLDNNDWNYKFKEVVVAENYSWNRSWIDTEKFVINESATFTINQGEGDENGTLVPRAEGVHADEAVISGSLVINGTEIEEGNRFDVYNSLVVNEGGSISIGGNSIFYIKEGVEFKLGENPVEATFDAEIFGPLEEQITITLDGSQERGYLLMPGENGGWIVKEDGPEVKHEIILPKEEDSFFHTRGMYDWIHRDNYHEQDFPPVCFNRIVVTEDYTTDSYISVKDLVVEAGKAFTLDWWKDDRSSDTGDSRIRLDETAIISGTFTIKGDGDNKTGTLEIVEDAVLTIAEGGSLETSGTGYILAEAGSIIKVGSTALTATIAGKSITFDGSQGAVCLQHENGTWTGKRVVIGENVELPRDEESFLYTLGWYYDDDSHKEFFEHDDNNNGIIEEGEKEELPPTFDTVTINGEYEFSNSVLANKLVVTPGSKLTFETDQDLPEKVYIDVDTTAKDDEGKDIFTTHKWAGQIRTGEAEIAGQVIIGNSEEINTWYNFEKNRVESEYAIKFLEIRDKLKITGNGQISLSGNGELSFGEYYDGLKQVIDIPSMNAISTEKTFVVNPCTTVKVANKIYTIHVKSGNPYDTAEHNGFVFDGVMNDVWARFATTTNGDWELKDEDGEPFAVWWGAPFENEYRVYFKKGSVKIGGSEFTTDDVFHSYTKGTPIEIELVPPTEFTGTPIVFINGGYYNIGEDYMRSDDFKTSDLWWENPATVTKLEVKDNKFTYTPKDDSGIEIYVYYDPEDIMYDAMYFVDRAYLNYGEFGDDGKYYLYPDRLYNPKAGQLDENGKKIEGNTKCGLNAAWAYPGNEFMVEVTQNNSNGTVEMTPGIDFYRVGNKVKALYQGFEILGGKSVEVEFKPASGYDLLAVTIDGTPYSPSAAGMTYSGGVYTLKITETPTVKDATLNGLYPEDFRKNDYVKIKKISATFGIPSYSGGGDSGSDSGSGTSTDVGTGTGTGTDAGNVGGGSGTTSGEEEPEVQRQTTTTDKADDGTQTTTTSTTYTDGSKVTEKVVEKPDGSSTSTTTTTEADGTKVVEKVEEKADGSSKATTTTTETDGTKKTETVEKKVDGTEVKTNTVKDADGNSTTEKVEKKTDGTVTTTNTTKDADGASTTEKVVEKPDGSVTTTSTEKDADGNVLSTSKVVEKTKEDGTKTITATEKNADGSSSTSKTTINTDGSSKTNTTTQNADGSTTKEKITEKADGSLTRTATTTDEDGNVLATEKEKVTVSKSGTETSTTTIENADGSSSESVVKTKADGTASSTLTETDADGNVSVTVGSTKKDGSEISKSYAVEDDGVVLTAVEATTASASIPASVKVNGKSVPVTTVGEGAMKDNTSVKKVTLAESITSIGEDAFSGAKNLKTIKLSANVTEIAPGAFDGIKSNATFYISAATDEEFNALVELLKKSGVGSKVKFKRA